jgi:hypothetical protein
MSCKGMQMDHNRQDVTTQAGTRACWRHRAAGMLIRTEIHHTTRQLVYYNSGIRRLAWLQCVMPPIKQFSAWLHKAD